MSVLPECLGRTSLAAPWPSRPTVGTSAQIGGQRLKFEVTRGRDGQSPRATLLSTHRGWQGVSHLRAIALKHFRDFVLLGTFKPMPFCVGLGGPETFCFVDIHAQSNPVIHRNDPARCNVLVLVLGGLLGSDYLQMPSLDLVDSSDVSAIPVHDRHPLDHEVKKGTAFHAVIWILSHRVLHYGRPLGSSNLRGAVTVS